MCKYCAIFCKGLEHPQIMVSAVGERGVLESVSCGSQGMNVSVLDILHKLNQMTFCVWFLSLNIMFSRFIYIVSVLHSLLWSNNIPLYEGTTICLSVDGCFYLLTIVNSAAMNKYVHVPQSVFLIPLGIHLGVELQGHVVILCLTWTEVTSKEEMASIISRSKEIKQQTVHWR